MNYVKVYKQLIQKRRDYPIDRTDDNPNVEYHHIIPKSEGGKDSPRNAKYNHKGTNIIGLTIKEHILAHILLSRILNSNNMICAEHFMLSDRNGDKTNLRLAAISKERFKKNQSLTMTEYWKSHEYDCTKLADEKKPRKVWMYDYEGNFIKEYPSMSSVAKELGINIRYVSDACNLIKRGYNKKYRFVFAGKSAFEYEEKDFNDSIDEYYKFLYDKDVIKYRLNNMIDYEENVNYIDYNISTIEFNIDYKTDNHKSNKNYLKHKIDFTPYNYTKYKIDFNHYKSQVLQYTPDVKHKFDINLQKLPVIQYTLDEKNKKECYYNYDDITTDTVEWWSDENEDF